jgi:uncharacterized protein YggE
MFTRASCLILALVLPVAAQLSGGPGLPPTVRAHGQGMASARPDQAQIDIGVLTEAATAQAAGQQNAKQLSDVLAELKKMLPPAATVETISYSLNPNYRYPRDGGKPTIAGYIATNIVRVTVDDLTLVGKVIDASTKTGANKINRIHFRLKDEQRVRARALAEATAQARANAEAMGKAAGIRLGGVVVLEDTTAPEVRPMMREMAMARAADAAPTPVEPGMIDVHVTVTIWVAIEGQGSAR